MNSSFRLAALGFILLLALHPLRAHQSNPDSLVITDVNVVDVRTGEIRADQVVIIEGNRITAVGSRKETRYSHRNSAINARGGYLIPGLWDLHVSLVFCVSF